MRILFLSIVLCLAAVQSAAADGFRPATTAEIANGAIRHGVAVRVEGAIADAFQDETNRRYVFLLLRDGQDSVYVGIEVGSPSDYAKVIPLIGARVAIQGTTFHFIGQKRIHTGRSLIARGLDSITVLTPAPDPFAVPQIDISPYVNPEVFARTSRRRTTGRVLAVWEPRSFLIRTKRGYWQTTNLVLRVECTDERLPACGDSVEVAGLPETDLYRINLTRAVWRPAPPMEFPAESALAVTARSILTGDVSREGIDYLLQGRLVRLVGVVQALPNDVAREKIVYVDNEGVTVPIDVSGLREGPGGIRLSSTVEVTGVCVFDLDNWRPNAVFPQIKGFRIIPRTARDIRVVAVPSQWTTARLVTTLGVVLLVLVVIVIWNLTLHRLVERRGRELAAESVAHAESDLKFFERTRLAVELHDSIAQYMTGAAMEVRAAIQAHAAKDPKTADHLHVALQAINSSRGELRNCIWDLRNNALESSDPNDAIALALAPHLGDTKLTVRFNVPRERFSDNAMHAIICIVRELTVNAIRHGGATEVRIAGAIEDGKLLCSVRDNGCGFKPEEAPGMEQGHFGLQGIRERLKERRGTLTLESAPGAGTKATLSIELPKTTSNE